MKRIIALTILVITSFACKSAISPGEPATAPKVGSQLVYQVNASHADGTGACVLTEYDTVMSGSSSGFTVARHSDTIGNIATSALDNFLILPSGDLSDVYSCGCDTVPLPIASHQSFDPRPNGFVTPIKLNGFVDPSAHVYLHSQYEGEETIDAAGSSFPCTKVSEIETITMMFPTARAGSQYDTAIITHRFWYSYDLHFFVKDELVQTGTDTITTQLNSTNLNYTRKLVSYK